jgi:hypothetical protein
VSEVEVNWNEIQVSGNQTVRDLWHQKDVGEFNQKFIAKVPAQGVVMIKIMKK